MPKSAEHSISIILGYGVGSTTCQKGGQVVHTNGPCLIQWQSYIVNASKNAYETKINKVMNLFC